MNMLQMALGAGLATTIAEDEKKKRERNIIEIPNNATNGDVIKAMFPNLEWIGNDRNVDFYYLDSDTPYAPHLSTFQSWWNAPYKREGE